jgi:hypothetical protein
LAPPAPRAQPQPPPPDVTCTPAARGNRTIAYPFWMCGRHSWAPPLRAGALRIDGAGAWFVHADGGTSLKTAALHRLRSQRGGMVRLGAEGVGSRDHQAWVPTGVEGAGKLRCGSCRYKEDRRSVRGSSDTVSPGDLFPSEERSSFAGSRGCAGCWWPTRCVASAR